MDNALRVLREEDVIRVVDKHTNDDGSLDNDISCILEEVKDIFSDCKIEPVEKEETYLSNRKVFIFQSDMDIENSTKVQKILYEQFKSGCVVVPDDIRLVKIEELYSR